MDEQKNLIEYCSSQNVRLVAVSKTISPNLIQPAYKSGLRDFGENRVKELIEKRPQLPADISWHMIGNLQRNKVKMITPFISLIQSVDSLPLLAEIDKCGRKDNRIIDCLLQVHIAREESKSGFSEAEVRDLINDPILESFTNIRIRGLMGMATYTRDQEQIRAEFRFLAKLYHEFGEKYSRSNIKMTILSMGMSGDYKIAVEEGSNMIRIGSLLFGARS